MFTKKKTQKEEKKKVQPQAPQEIEEVEEDFKEPTGEEARPKKNEKSTEDPAEEEELTEEKALQYFKNITNVLNNLIPRMENIEERVGRIEHNLRLDF